MNSLQRIEVGQRCYAKWPDNNMWYWGLVEGVVGSGSSAIFAVSYDDGDSYAGLSSTDVLSEQEYEYIYDLSLPLNVGDRCYAKWPETSTWHWGHVTAVEDPPSSEGQVEPRVYSVAFDDGCELETVCFPDIRSESRMLHRDVTGVWQQSQQGPTSTVETEEEDPSQLEQ